jgi:hypothetical protein
MATERNFIINAKVNTGNSAKDLKEVDNAVKGVNKTTETAAKDSGQYADRLADVRKQSQQGGQSLRQLSKVIQQYQAIALEAGANSPIGRQAIEEAAVLRDRIDQVSLATRRLADDGANVQAALQLGTGVVQGYQGVLGVTTLLGVENENLIETLTKLQAAQGVVNSLQAVQQALAKESVLVLKAQALGTGALSAAQAAYAAIVGTSTGALKLFRLALIGTGIGAVVVAIGALIANFETVKNVVLDLINTAIEPFRAALEFIGLVESKEDKARKQRHDAETERKRNELKEARKTAEGKIAAIEKEREAVGDRYDFEIRKLKAAGKDTQEAERQKRMFVLRSTRDQIQAINELIEARIAEIRATYKVNEAVAENFQVIKDLRAEQQKLKNTFVSTVQDMEVAEIESQTKRTEAGKKAAEERRKQLEKEREEERKQMLERMAEDAKAQATMLETIARLEDEFLQSKIAKETQERNAVFEKYTAIIDAARQAGEDVTLLEEAQQAALLEIQERYAAEREELQKLEDDKETARNEKKKQAELDLLNFKLDTAKATFDTLSNLANAFAGKNEKNQKRVFAVQKAAGIATGLVQTYQSAIAAYGSQFILGDATSIIRAKIAAATAIGAGLANVAKIAAQRFSATGGGGAGASGGGSFNAPSLANPQQQISLFGQANQGSEIFANNATADATSIVVTAQVVETDMTAVQNEVEAIQQLATL